MFFDSYYPSEPEPPLPKLDVWDTSKATMERGYKYMRLQSFGITLDVLRNSTAGCALLKFGKECDFRFVEAKKLPAEIKAAFHPHPKLFRNGHILYGSEVHAGMIGHELRHGWQHFSTATYITKPRSATEVVLRERFMEADARAVGFVIAVQCAAHLGYKHEYSEHMLATMPDIDKQACRYSFKQLAKLGEQPKLLRQAAREVFDSWITLAHAQDGYEDRIIKLLDIATTNRVSRVWRSLTAPNESKNMPHLTATGVRRGYLGRLACALSTSDDPALSGYLTETAGLSIDDQFYSRICSQRLDAAIAHF